MSGCECDIRPGGVVTTDVSSTPTDEPVSMATTVTVYVCSPSLPLIVVDPVNNNKSVNNNKQTF